MGRAPALQDGGHGNSQGATEAERLDGEGGPKRCLLHHTDTCRSPTFPEVYSEAGTLSVYMPTIRPVVCPMGIHQSDEARHHPPPGYGCAYDSLYRRHTDSRGIPFPGGGPSGSTDASVDRPGVHHQCTQINHHPDPEDRVPGSPGGLHLTTPEPARTETPPHQDRGEPASQELTGDSTTASSTDREAACCGAGSPPCTTVLPITSGRSSESPVPKQPELQHAAVPVSSSPGGADLVAGATCSMEWQGPPPQTTDCDHHLRCLSDGMGSGLQWLQNRGSLEPLRAGDAHQLSGVAGSNPGGKDLPEGSVRCDSSFAAGQPDCSGLYQQHGGHSVTPTHRPGQSPLAVGPVQGHCADCRVHTGDGERCGRCRVQVHVRQDRLETAYQCVPAGEQEMGTTGGGPVCNSSVYTTVSFLQLETGPTGRGNGCFQPGLGLHQGVCEPSMVPNRESPVTSEEPTSCVNPSGSCVEGPTLVPCPTGNAVRLSSAAPTLNEPLSVDSQCNQNGSDTPTSHMACLRQKFGSGDLSEAAKELLLKSWRSKTSTAYDSHFKKWLGWCSERNLDPVSAVANFLADLHSQGYQTNSLNAYTSAISSVHDRVDDMDVGKHPLIARVLSMPDLLFLAIQPPGMSR